MLVVALPDREDSLERVRGRLDPRRDRRSGFRVDPCPQRGEVCHACGRRKRAHCGAYHCQSEDRACAQRADSEADERLAWDLRDRVWEMRRSARRQVAQICRNSTRHHPSSHPSSSSSSSPSALPSFLVGRRLAACSEEAKPDADCKRDCACSGHRSSQVLQLERQRRHLWNAIIHTLIHPLITSCSFHHTHNRKRKNATRLLQDGDGAKSMIKRSVETPLFLWA